MTLTQSELIAVNTHSQTVFRAVSLITKSREDNRPM